MQPLRRVLFSFATLLMILILGTAGYCLIEGWTPFESLYMTVITLATVGFREVHNLSPRGQGFTIVLILSGAGLIAYTMSSLIQFAVEGQLRAFLGRKKMAKQISQLKDHYIVCGYGRIGQMVCREFAAKPIPVVVIEKNPDLYQQLVDAGIPCLQGDATHDELLLKAGIERARGLITITNADTDNLFITLSARGLNPQLFILARCADPSSEIKLKRAGATQVVSPYTIGAQRIAQAVLRPSVVDFLEVAAARESLQVQIEEMPIAPDSVLVAKELRSSGVRELGVIIVGIRKAEGRMLFNPGPATVLEAGDILITLGEYPAIQQLLTIATGLHADA